MASRYQNNKVQKLKDGRQVYRTKIYPNIPLTDTDMYIVTQEGDRLDTLAYQYYGDQSLWWIIATANNIHDASFAVEDGTILRVPQNYLEIINNFN
jgi:phage tail protein X